MKLKAVCYSHKHNISVWHVERQLGQKNKRKVFSEKFYAAFSGQLLD